MMAKNGEMAAEKSEFEIAVVGGGAAGAMAFLRAVLDYDDSVLFLGDAKTRKKGRDTWVAEIDNIPGMHEMKSPILRASRSTVEWLQKHPQLSKKARVIRQAVKRIEKEGNGFRLYYSEKDEEKSVFSRFIILATGLMDIQPLIDGTIEPIFPFANRSDVLYCVRCDGHRTLGHTLSLFGNSDTAIYIAVLLKERYGHESADILVNGLERKFTKKALAVADENDFRIHDSPVVEVLGDPKRNGKGLEGYRLANGDVVHTTKTIVALGTIVYNDLLKNLGGAIAEDGRVIVNDMYETTVPGVFAVGDLVAGRKLQVYTAWEEAVDAAEAINRRLRKSRPQKLKS